MATLFEQIMEDARLYDNEKLLNASLLPRDEAPRQPNEERLSRMLVHHIQQATAGGAERRY